MACPLDCPHLRDARQHEKLAALDPEAMPNRDVRVSEQLLQENEALLSFLGQSLVGMALASAEPVDFDLREALEALIRTYRTRQSGLYYDSVPNNAIAARIYRGLEESLERFRKEETEKLGASRTRDSSVLAMLVFLQRLELDRNNGRRKGRAFIDLLHEFYVPSGPAASEASPLLLP